MTSQVARRAQLAIPRKTRAREDDSLLSLPPFLVFGFIAIFVRGIFEITSIAVLPELLVQFLLAFGLICLGVHCLINVQTYLKHAFFIVLLLVIGVISYIRSGETMPITVIMTLIAAASVDDINKLLRFWLFLATTLLLALVLVYSLVWLVDSQSLTLFYRYEDGTTTIRHSFFFVHPNMFGCMVFMVTATWLYLSRKRFTLGRLIAVVALAFFVFFASGSRTSSILLALIGLLFFFNKRLRGLEFGRLRIAIGILPMVLFVLVLLVSGPLYNPQLGELFTGRVSLWHYCYVNQGVTLFGQPFVQSTSTTLTGYTYYYTTLDDAYASGLYVCGIAFCAWFCWAFFRVCASKNLSDITTLSVLTAMLLFGITEVHMFSVVLCGPLLLLSGAMREPKAGPQTIRF